MIIQFDAIIRFELFVEMYYNNDGLKSIWRYRNEPV